MLLDEATSQLFFAVLPAFIASLPRPVEVSEDQVRGLGISPDNIQAQLAVNIATVRLRQAIHEIPKRFNSIQSAQHLTADACTEAAEALEDMLCEMERLISTGILEYRSVDQAEKFNRLAVLRNLLENAPWPNLEEEPVVPPDALRWVTYLQLKNPATEAAQYRCIASQVERFNIIMRRVFDLESIASESTAAHLVESSRLSPEIDERKRDSETLLAAKKLSLITRNLSSLMRKPSLEPCEPPHCTMIHLNGFDQLEIDTLITLCGPNKLGKAGKGQAKKWHAITWVAEAPAEEMAQSTICNKVRSSRKLMSRLRVQLGADGSWSGTVSERMTAFAKKPTLTLDSALNPKQGPSLRKKERLDLAVKIAKSFFCLIWSPLVCNSWNSATIHILEQRGQTAEQTPTIKPYIEGQLHVHHPNPEWKPDFKSRRPLILDIGVLLWELLFSRKIVVTSEDGRSGAGHEEDSDESDDEDPIFYALSREEIAARDSCVDEICLNIIANCLELYVLSDDEANCATLQSDIYHKIVRPLWAYVETYNNSTSSVASRTHTPSLLPTQRRIQFTERSIPSASLPQATLLSPALLANMTIPEVEPPPPTSSSTSAMAALLTSGGTVSPDHRTMYEEPALTLHPEPQTTSSAGWLERFDVLKRCLQNTAALSSPVKIAILDTGCDIENDFFTGPGIDLIDSVEANWTDYIGGETTPVDEDPGRHGTALTALLLRLIPNCASIHVARVARNAADLTDAKKNTAKAILDAIEVWKADIISISFGFGSESSAVKKAIVEAETIRDDRIIFFAAANNDGLNEPELFPAELENVVSVRGTLHDGEFKQKYNPDSWGHKSGLAQYGTLAVDVPCAWTTDALTKSGCSVATPIMAAIAAIVISGILSVFLEMTQRQGKTDRLYLTPWFLFEQVSPVFLVGNALSKVPRKDSTP